jgi:hypothetical protein
MHAIGLALFALMLGACLLSSAGAQAATSYSANPATTTMPSGVIQLAGSYFNSPGKLNDKYLAGKAGGRYGIGGSESVIFKKKKKK